MQYKITVTAIKEEQVLQEVYVNESERTKEHPESYRNELMPKKVEEVIFMQIREKIDLPAIIHACNTADVPIQQ